MICFNFAVDPVQPLLERLAHHLHFLLEAYVTGKSRLLAKAMKQCGFALCSITRYQLHSSSRTCQQNTNPLFRLPFTSGLISPYNHLPWWKGSVVNTISSTLNMSCSLQPVQIVLRHLLKSSTTAWSKSATFPDGVVIRTLCHFCHLSSQPLEPEKHR